jgi:two-component system OmpR family response regulator
VAPWYARRFGPSKPFKQAILGMNSREDFERALAEFFAWRARFCDERGELLPKFQPEPMVASFMRDADDPVFTRDAIIDRLHGPGFAITDRTIDSHVRNLRGKFTALGGHDVIETRAGVGYRLGACTGARA